MEVEVVRGVELGENIVVAGHRERRPSSARIVPLGALQAHNFSEVVAVNADIANDDDIPMGHGIGVVVAGTCPLLLPSFVMGIISILALVSEAAIITVLATGVPTTSYVVVSVSLFLAMIVLWGAGLCCQCGRLGFIRQFLDPVIEVKDVDGLRQLWREALEKPLECTVRGLSVHRRGLDITNTTEVSFASTAIPFDTVPIDHSDYLPDLELRDGSMVLLKWDLNLNGPLTKEVARWLDHFKTASTAPHSETEVRLALGSRRNNSALVVIGRRPDVMKRSRFICLMIACMDSCAGCWLSQRTTVVELQVKKFHNVA